jgi:catechol 2,3-dioxygenase-like lactoylglutathione lyase family enzyme
MLRQAHVSTRLPVEDLARARAFYAEKLGLEPVEERAGGLLYRLAGSGEFSLYVSKGRPSGTFTQMAFQVEYVDAVVAELKRRGVRFEDVDLPGLKTVDSIADIEGNYPSKGRGERSAWFRDSEGNMLGLGQAVR